ncbi:MAG: aminotransferase class I/II-fold pyridoxal phosphate-dependent enzyme [Planctomycetota bacterium]|nr:aminotransferase class I/II-fold pyridoxal phosphate-dependent enzyme [Planctomycetota bacterium]
MNERLQNLPTYPMVQLSAWSQSIVDQGLELLDFGTGDPREPTPAILRQAMIDGVDEVSQYPPTPGTQGLREAVCGYLQRRFGLVFDPNEEVVATFGSKEALFHLPMTFVHEGAARNVVVYGEPAYPVYRIGTLFANAEPHAVILGPGNGYQLDPDALPDGLLDKTAMVFLNYPHNPSGYKLRDELYERWVEVQKEHGFVLVSDECYADLNYEGELPKSLLEFGREGCLAVHSLSKRSGMTGYRSGFVAGDPKLIATYRRFRASMGTAPQSFVQAAAQLAWTEDQHVQDRLQVFADKRDVLVEMAAARGLKVHGSEAGLYLWLEIPASAADDVAYAERCREQGILVAPGSFFGEGQDRFVRLALVPTLEQCKVAAARWPQP